MKSQYSRLSRRNKSGLNCNTTVGHGTVVQPVATTLAVVTTEQPVVAFTVQPVVITAQPVATTGTVQTVVIQYNQLSHQNNHSA
jgi:hypothetical protein